MQPDIDEALRYLGVQCAPDTVLRDQMAELAVWLTAQVTPRHIWRLQPVTRKDGVLMPGNIQLTGNSADRMLADCEEAIVLVATLGTDFDLLIRRTQARDMSRAVMLDALGSAYVEAACDAAEQEITAHFPGRFLTDRFSPGYGDLPLDIQSCLLHTAQAHLIGVQTAPSLLMIPQKSVSAIIGLSSRPQIPRIRGCAYCAMNQTCALRKAGTTCDI